MADTVGQDASTVGMVPPLPDDASDIDGTDAKEIFFRNVSYRSLSLGTGFEDFFDEGYPSILVRDEYIALLEFITRFEKVKGEYWSPANPAQVRMHIKLP